MEADSSAGPAIAARVRLARTRGGFSLRGLAAELGVSPATLSQIENGKTRVSVGRLTEIADAVGMTAQEVLDLPLDAEADAPSPEDASDAAEGGEQRPPDWRTYPPLTLGPVLDAALEEFLEAGYHGTSVRDIARRCGMSVSGLYHHCASKQEMLLKILEYTMNELFWRSQAAREESSDPVDRFASLIECLTLFHTHRRELGFVGASEMRSLDTANRDYIAEMRNGVQRLVDEETSAAIDQRRFHNARPHEAARAVVTMCTALPQWFRPEGPLTPEEIASHYVEFALDLMRFRAQ